MSFAWLKLYMPRGIYARAALILLLPVVVVQVVVSVLFAQRHFEGVTVQMADTVVREIRLVLQDLSDLPRGADVQVATADVADPLDMRVERIPAPELEAPNSRDWDDFSGLVVIRRLSEQVPEIRSFDLSSSAAVRLAVDTGTGPVAITFDRRRISARNPHQLLVYMVFFSILTTMVSFVYLRNQLRPIRRLARAAEAFGRGRNIPFSPAGASELRAAGTAFVDMRNRIERQIETRTLMLSGVSHDLRTPLTRMRLSLSMLEDDDREALEQDVDDMQGMIDAFLDFAKGDGQGEPERTDPVALATTVVEDAQRAGQPVSLAEVEGAGTVRLRPLAMRRALDNLVSNAVRYGGRAEVSVRITEKSLRFRVEDDGPGIPEEQRADAQRPFTRLDPARNQDKGSGVGLGLAIATDIARGHGGTLRLGHSSKLGGLRADIVIAR
ncbi:ATP-binding protein [Tateyamaria sp. ANG-S1]|uniref:ATP-binding protein n=1 Tax=Tateyamaria sp. ANG-S1 TaxID=1577905 RepID=UPI00057D2597|nr:ATP-binding protein [Tateyamaria sp. ANG-S1]KIC48910.1 histidine kinase [Tateyamaria sp. ANG-S1]